MNYFARFTEGAKNALGLAAEYARSLGHNYVGTEHVLAGLLEEGGETAKILNEQGITEENVKDLILRAVGKGDYVFNDNFGYTPRVKMILELSKAIARQLGHNYVGSEHMLFALLRERECLANRILLALNAEHFGKGRTRPGRCRRRNGCCGPWKYAQAG